MRSSSQFSEHDFRTLNSAVLTLEGHLLNSAGSTHLSLSYTSVLVVLVQCFRAPAASCLGWTFCSVRLGNKGAVCLPQFRAADSVGPKTSLIGKSYIQRSSLQRLVFICFFLLRPFLTRIFSRKGLDWRGQKILGAKKKETFLTRNFFRKVSSPKISSGKKSRMLPAEEIFKPKISWRQEQILRGNFRSLDNRTEISKIITRGVPLPSTG